MSAATQFSQWMQSVQASTEAALDAYLPPPDATPQRLHAAMRYAVLGGGKRVRPLLVHAAGALFDADAQALARAGAAVEMIHAYSLVHDDMPCMDDDALRRGKPTVHVEFDQATALLVGDALQAQAFETVAGIALDPAHTVAMLQLLAQAAGSLGMCGGQAIDLASVGRNPRPAPGRPYPNEGGQRLHSGFHREPPRDRGPGTPRPGRCSSERCGRHPALTDHRSCCP